MESSNTKVSQVKKCDPTTALFESLNSIARESILHAGVEGKLELKELRIPIDSFQLLPLDESKPIVHEDILSKPNDAKGE